jgi:hypothetical protein
MWLPLLLNYLCGYPALQPMSRSKLTPVALLLLFKSFQQTLRAPTTKLRCISKARDYSQSTSSAPSEEELASARKWVATFTPSSVPQDIGDVSFSRSSGPGGQNVNK